MHKPSSCVHCPCERRTCVKRKASESYVCNNVLHPVVDPRGLKGGKGYIKLMSMLFVSLQCSYSSLVLCFIKSDQTSQGEPSWLARSSRNKECTIYNSFSAGCLQVSAISTGCCSKDAVVNAKKQCHSLRQETTT